MRLRLVVLLGVAAGALGAAEVAFAYFGSAPQTRLQTAAAATVPRGVTPNARLVSAGGTTVGISFSTVSSGTTQLSSYTVVRLNAATDTGTPINGACALATATVTCSDSPGDGVWRYADTPTFNRWTGVASAASAPVKVTLPPPVLARVTVTDAIAGTAGFVRQGAGYVAYAQVAPGGAPISAVTADLRALTAGATAAPLTSAGGPWVIGGQSYDYRSARLTTRAPLAESGNPYSFVVAAVDRLSHMTSVSGATRVDNTGPAGGYVDATGLVGASDRYSTSRSLAISFSGGADAGAGLASTGVRLLRADAALNSTDGITDGTCGRYGAFSQVAVDPVSPVTDSHGVASGRCYRYELVASDRLGNTTTYMSPDVKVEAAAARTLTPAATSLTSLSGADAQFETVVAGVPTVFFNPNAIGSFTVSTIASDGLSGVVGVTFPALAGFSGGGLKTIPTSGAAFRMSYVWAAAIDASSGLQALTATDNASLAATASGAFAVDADGTAPSGGAITATGGSATSTRTSGTIALAVTAFADAGSGIATNVITRSTAPLSAGTCGSFVGSTVVSGPVDKGLAAGCYRYALTGADRVGNTATTASAIVIVATT